MRERQKSGYVRRLGQGTGVQEADWEKLQGVTPKVVDIREQAVAKTTNTASLSKLHSPLLSTYQMFLTVQYQAAFVRA